MSERRPRPEVAGMTPEQIDAANRARLRRDYRDLSPEQRIKQVADLSRQAAKLAARPDGA